MIIQWASVASPTHLGLWLGWPFGPFWFSENFFYFLFSRIIFFQLWITIDHSMSERSELIIVATFKSKQSFRLHFSNFRTNWSFNGRAIASPTHLGLWLGWPFGPFWFSENFFLFFIFQDYIFPTLDNNWSFNERA